MMRHIISTLLVAFVFFSAAKAVPASATKLYGFRFDAGTLNAGAAQMWDSTLNHSYQLSDSKKVSYQITRAHSLNNHSTDFYLLLGLCALLGAIKTLHPKYFNDLWRAFLNPTLGSRQLKEIIQSSSLPNLLMNLFSSVVIGLYVYYLISLNIDWRFAEIPNSIIVIMLCAGSVLLYISKYTFISFTGWAFNISQTTDQYNFNVFLVNKVLGIVLLPFVVCFAFFNQAWHNSLCILSILLVFLLFCNRYLRSWGIFAPFFMNSRFHFFVYLCAFEILPLAVLIKMALRVL